jgi:hypothetical protein
LIQCALRTIRKLRRDEKAIEGRRGGRAATVHKKSKKVEIKHGKFPINPAKSEDRAKSRKCSFLDDNRPLVV